MSSDDNTPEDGLYPRVNLEPRVHTLTGDSLRPNANYTGGRGSLRDQLAFSSYDGKRNLYSALGYVQDPGYEHFRARYDRSDTATALVDRLPKKAWATPTIEDTAETDETTDFEAAVESFLGGDVTREDPIAVMERVSRFERVGQYALLFLGVADAAVEDGDHTDLAKPVAEASLGAGPDAGPEAPLADINYLTPYDEGRIAIDEQEIVTDPSSMQYGRPEFYDVDLGDVRGPTKIHHSRVIHVVGDVFDDELRSPSVLLQSLNRIDDIEKILGGSAEAYWRSAYQGLVATPPESAGAGAMGGSLADKGEKLHDQIEQYVHNMQRVIFSSADVETLDTTVSPPTEHVESQYRAISAGHNIPQSILMGNETGERATEQDLRILHERAGDYRTGFCASRVLRPTLDRLLQWGVFPPPEGEGYRVEWPELGEPTEQERAEIMKTKAAALKAASGGAPDLLASVPEIRKKALGWRAERGSEVEQVSLEPVTANELGDDVDLDDVPDDEGLASLDDLEPYAGAGE